MRNLTITTTDRSELEDILDDDERLLWSGQPGYGRRLIQAVGDEKKIHIGLLVGAIVMWMSLPFINAEAVLDRIDAPWIYGAATLAFAGKSFQLASQRQYVLHNLAYFVTDRRAIVCRRGRNWRLGMRLYVVSCPHSETFPYSVVPSRPYPSLRIGTLLSEDQVQPFGLGLAHPGHPILWGRATYPVMFDYVPNAHALLEIIRSCADGAPAQFRH